MGQYKIKCVSTGMYGRGRVCMGMGEWVWVREKNMGTGEFVWVWENVYGYGEQFGYWRV